MVLEAVERRLLFPDVDVSVELGQKDCLLTRHISEIESDQAGEVTSPRAVLAELGLGQQATMLDCRIVR